MQKTLQSFAFAVCMALVLSGCGAITLQNTDELLRAPALGPGQGELQQALAAYLKEEPQYKFPKEGDWHSPLLKADLDGDGQEEGVLFYSMQASTQHKDKGNNVYMAILEQADDGWMVVQEKEGLSTDIASVDVADMMDDGTRQLIVGYATSTLGNRTMALYQYKEGAVIEQHYGSYYNYLLGDFTVQGRTDLAVVSGPDQQVGNLKLNFLIGQNGTFVLAQEPVDLFTNFSACLGLYPSVDAEGKQILVVDGMVSNMIASQILYYSSEGVGFYDMPASVAQIAAETSRSSTWLTSRDVDFDGVVEIPTEKKLGDNSDLGMADEKGDTTMRQVDWMDFTVQPAEIKEFGLLDPDFGLYIRLPESWRGNVTVEIGEQPGEWKVLRDGTSATLLSMRLLEAGETVPERAWRVPGADEMYLIVSDALVLTETMGIRTVLLS